jgi:1,3-beta-glucanosyltransferase GAS3
MLIDVNSPLVGQSIDRVEPWTTYTSSYLNRTFAVVEAFKSYENTLLFFAGNEVINDVPSGGVVPPYMRVSLRYPRVVRLLTCIGRHSRSQELHCEALFS